MKKLGLGIFLVLTLLVQSKTTVKAAFNPDLNGDGVVNAIDYALFIPKFGNPYTLLDYNTFLGSFGKTVATNKMQVGVIYGGLTSNNHKQRNATSAILAHPEWQSLWPYFTVVRSGDTIQIDQDDQRIVDQEIQLSSTAGINFWIFEGMPTPDAENVIGELNMYMNSQYKSSLKFSLLIAPDDLTQTNWQQKYIPLLTGYLKDPQYVKVKNGQPVLSIMLFDNLVKSLGEAGAKQRMLDFSNAMQSSLGVKPYLSMVDLGSSTSYAKAKYFGFDARSSYLGSPYAVYNVHGSPFSKMADGTATYWDTFKKSDLDYIPSVSTGLDGRPRGQDLYSGMGWNANSAWTQKATPQEIGNLTTRAVNWVKNNTSVTSAHLLTISEWSDVAEGQWILPTLGDGNGRLNAIAKALGGKQMATPISPYVDNPPPLPPTDPVTINAPIVSGATVKANQPIHITGKADIAARITMQLGASTYSFVNYKGSTFGTASFAIDMPALPAGGPYTLSVNGDVVPLKITNIMVK